ncbi:MAG: DsbA family oxidoreductase [Pseudomonadales bacterium]|nr:DsbA family oxidoreductase [Pseudomonadales bacterium]
MQIDIISDVVCPWCYVAKRQLEHALAQRPGLQVQIRWFPYQLHPEAPAEGYPYRETIERKYGRQMIEMMFGRITAAGAAVGLELHLDRIARGANTLDAHRLIEWARAEDREDAMVEALFRAYFRDGRDVGDRATLAAIAGEVGLDGAAIAARLTGSEGRAEVLERIRYSRDQGVTGVPFFVFDGKLSLSGAQGEETFLQVLDRVAAERDTGAYCTPDGCL